jgi:YesN/AraC family two-component response regulator
MTGAVSMPYQVLLVDDDAAFREEFREALEDYVVIEAPDGASALDLLRKPNEIDLVLLDVMMPGMRGTEVLREMKRIAPGLGIVIITGYSSTDVAVEALKGHADDYLEKPVDIEKARRLIAGMLKEKDDGPGIENLDIKGKVERVKLFAERNVDKKVSLEDAAAAVGLSPKYLSRIFKEETGVGFVEYRIEAKIREAQKMLAETGMNVSQIADKLAYENVESFIRAFGKFVGKTPSEYRKASKGTSES